MIKKKRHLTNKILKLRKKLKKKKRLLKPKQRIKRMANLLNKKKMIMRAMTMGTMMRKKRKLHVNENEKRKHLV